MVPLIGLLGTLLSSVIGAGVSVYQTKQQKRMNEHLTGSQEEQNQWNAAQAGIARDFNAAEAQKSRDFTQFMARNKYTMETQSMQDAGVNPALVYGGGNLVPTAANGAAATAPAAAGQGSGNAGIVDLMNLIEPMMSLVRMPLEMAQMKADLKKTETETEGLSLTNQITEGTKDAIIKVTNMEPDKRQAEIDHILTQVKGEDLKNQILSVDLLQKNLDYKQNQRMYDLVFDMQRMQNDYQKFVNDHQEKQWNIEYGKICAEINELHTRAMKNMSDIEVNDVMKGLYSAQEGLVKEQTNTERERQSLTRAQTTHEKVKTWQDFNDPKAHITRSIVDPMSGIHDFWKGFDDKLGSNIQRFGHNTRVQFKVYGKHFDPKQQQMSVREQAEAIATMYASYGQAFEEYGSAE